MVGGAGGGGGAMSWACFSADALPSTLDVVVGATANGGAGGPGIVIVRVPSVFALSGSPTPARTLSTHPGGDKIAKFTASGTLTIS